MFVTVDVLYGESDRATLVPAAALWENPRTGVQGMFVGVPAILGKNGMEQVIQLDLTAEEKEAFAHSSGAVRKTCDEVDEMLKTL